MKNVYEEPNIKTFTGENRTFHIQNLIEICFRRKKN